MSDTRALADKETVSSLTPASDKAVAIVGGQVRLITCDNLVVGSTAKAHAASHGSGQPDAVTIAESQVTNLTTDLGNKQAAHANLTSLAGLTYVSASFVKMTAAGTFVLDTNTYSLSSHTHTDISSAALVGGRLTLESGVPVSTTNQSAKTTLYYTPAVHDQIGIYDGSAWQARTFTEISIGVTATMNGTLTNGNASVSGITSTAQLVAGMEVTGTGIQASTTIASVDSGTAITLDKTATADGAQSLTFKIPASKIVDVYATWTGAAVQLVYGPLWTNTTTRATDIARQNGVWVQSGTATRRFLGTVGTTTTAGQTAQVFGGDDTAPNMLLWNVSNQVPVALRAHDTTDSWNYTTLTLRQKNNSANNQFNLLCGVATVFTAASYVLVYNANGGTRIICFSLDATNAVAADSSGGYADNVPDTAYYPLIARYDGLIPVGLHYVASLEASSALGTSTWYGDAGGTALGHKSALSGVWIC